MALALSAAAGVGLAGSAQAAATAAPLGTADAFAVLAGAGITNTGPTVLDGDLGTFPTTSVTGGSSIVLTGVDHGGDAVTQQAKDDLRAAYDAAAAQGPATPVVADLGGQVLAPGVHGSASSLALTGTLVLDAGGDRSAVFVLQAGSTLTTASASRVQLVGGAQACRVFWQVGSSATLGTASSLVGTVLALTDITLSTGAAVEGRLLARNGAVVLDTSTVTRPGCLAPAVVAPSGSPSASPAVTPSATPTGTPATSPSPTASGSASTPSTPSGTTPSPTPSASPTVVVVGPTLAPPSTSPPSTGPASAPLSPALPAAPVPAGPLPPAPVPALPGAAGSAVGAQPVGAGPFPAGTAGDGTQVTAVPVGGVAAGGAAPRPAEALPAALTALVALSLLATSRARWRAS